MCEQMTVTQQLISHRFEMQDQIVANSGVFVGTQFKWLLRTSDVPAKRQRTTLVHNYSTVISFHAKNTYDCT